MDFSSLTPLAGGHSGETFLAEAGGERSVVRIYHRPGHRGPEAAEVDAALLRLVRGLVPVPEVLEVRRPDAAAGVPGLLVTSYLPGVRGDELLPRLDAAGRRRLGEELGRLIATLGGIPMLRPGAFIDAGLRLGPLPGAEELPGWVEEHLDRLPHWTPGERDALSEVAGRAQRILDTVERTCLVHSDLNPKNLLVDPDALTVTGVLDWEFAHAGHPFTDLGNLLRFERDEDFTSAVLAAYDVARGVPPAVALELARAADLWALVELASRRGGNPVADAADDLLRTIARTGDLHAAGWTRAGGPA